MKSGVRVQKHVRLSHFMIPTEAGIDGKAGNDGIGLLFPMEYYQLFMQSNLFKR